MICHSIVIIIINSSPFLARKKNSPKTCWALTVNAAEQPQPRWLGGVWGNEQPFKVWAKVNLKSYKLSTYGSFSSYATNRPTTVGQTDTDGILREEWWFRPNFQILLPRINFLLTLIFSCLGSKLLIFKRNVCDAIRQPSISDLCKLTNTTALLWRDLKGSKLGSTNVATYVSQLPHKTVFPPNLFTCQKMAVKNA